MPRHKLEVLAEKKDKAHLERATFSGCKKKTLPQRKRIIRKKNTAKKMRVIFWGCDAAEWCESFDRGVLRPNWCIRAYLLIYQANDSLRKPHRLSASSEHQTEESAGGSLLLVRTRLNIRPSNEVKCERMQETLKSMGWQGCESIYIN